MPDVAAVDDCFAAIGSTLPFDAAAPFFCDARRPCPNWRNHVHVEGADASESSEFPKRFAMWLALYINTEADRRAALRDN